MNAVYDLMMRHNFRIVRSVRIKIDHNLLANPGAKIENYTNAEGTTLDNYYTILLSQVDFNDYL